MKLENIDKARYRKHLNMVIALSALLFATLSLGLAQGAIALFTDGEGTHFEINLTGVIIAMVIVGVLLNKVKHHPFMMEVYYVWRLKQQINLITRKLRALEQAAKQQDVTAIHILSFYYQACRQLYNLDDNTITMDELTIKSSALEQQKDELNLALNISDYRSDWLKGY